MRLQKPTKTMAVAPRPCTSSRRNCSQDSFRKVQFPCLLVALALLTLGETRRWLVRLSSTGASFTEQGRQKQNQQASPTYPVNVLYGLSGNESGFLSEFETSLKSVLLNAPMSWPLDVHVLADGDAFFALETVWKQTQLEQWRTRNPIHIHAYNIQPYLKQWENETTELFRSRWKEDYRVEDTTYQHTIGTMFRLFSHKVLPTSVHKILYLDPDALVMANLQELWQHLDPDALFQWGIDSRCAGFMILDNQQLPEVWKLAAQAPLFNISETSGEGANDQLIFMAINETFPERVAILDKPWDINVADGAWRYAENFAEARPEVGMMHFNGGIAAKESAYKRHDFLTTDKQTMQDTWGLAHYYSRMPWQWAQYWAYSMVTPGETSSKNVSGDGSSSNDERRGHPLVIVRHDEIVSLEPETPVNMSEALKSMLKSAN